MEGIILVGIRGAAYQGILDTSCRPLRVGSVSIQVWATSHWACLLLPDRSSAGIPTIVYLFSARFISLTLSAGLSRLHRKSINSVPGWSLLVWQLLWQLTSRRRLNRASKLLRWIVWR